MHVSIGLPPLGHATELRVFIDPDLLKHPEVEASGGLVTDRKGD